MIVFRVYTRYFVLFLNIVFEFAYVSSYFIGRKSKGLFVPELISTFSSGNSFVHTTLVTKTQETYPVHDFQSYLWPWNIHHLRQQCSYW